MDSGGGSGGNGGGGSDSGAKGGDGSLSPYEGFQFATNVLRKRKAGRGDGADPMAFLSPEQAAERVLARASGQKGLSVSEKGRGASRAVNRVRDSGEATDAVDSVDAWGGRIADGPAVGIDFGTSNSCVALWSAEDRCASAVADGEGRTTLPTLVSYAVPPAIVGHLAVEHAQTDPECVVRHVKRLVGRRGLDDEDVKREAAHSRVKVQAARRGDGLVYSIPAGSGRGHTDISPQKVAEDVFSHLRRHVRRRLKKEISNCVVSVPAHFSSIQREAIQEAASKAGWNVMQLIAEPTAAAMAYGLFVAGTKKVLVYDLGGGTLDVTLVDVKEGVMEVQAMDGVAFLGGEDFTRSLAAQAAKGLGRDAGIAWSDLRDAAEVAKVHLSESDSATVEDPDSDRSVTISRAEFEGHCVELLERCMEPVFNVLEDAQVEATQVDQVVLVGGATRMPRIEQELGKLFGSESLNHDVHPDEAVAHGAAVQAALLCGADPALVRDSMMLDVAALSVGIKGPSGEMIVMVPRNSKIPAEARHMIMLDPAKHITTVSIDVYQGESEDAADNQWLGHHDFPSAGAAQLELLCRVNPSGVVSVMARAHQSAPSAPAAISNAVIVAGALLMFLIYVAIKLLFAKERLAAQGIEM